MGEATPAKYYEDFLLKKEGKSKWTEYWVIIRGNWMLFYTEKGSTDRDKLKGSIELVPDTKCSPARRRTYSFPFYISTKKGSHLFKCQSNLKRHQWIYVIGLAYKHAPPVPPPSFIPMGPVVIDKSDGEHLASWQTNKQSSERQSDGDDGDNDDDDGEDSYSLPPGVIIVSTLPNELMENEENNDKNSSRVNERVIPDSETSTTKKDRLNPPRVTFPKQISKSADTIGSPSRRSRHDFSPLRHHGYGPDLDRPSTSPLPSNVHLHIPGYPSYGHGTQLKFSRHMTSSAPDFNALSLGNGI
ncbi:uncharacterized protein LOC5503181 isoform X2 [Nematostella vectensis]|uniref:uncharacterized protein LOC5503181 isoform X2 n=1 Tax=Nematostella vectensis TaxID=45351 RepID=UPI0020770F2B|nr:uncharacterized protein LOC5503181 isoform X2 [Nematostella vectensis]